MFNVQSLSGSFTLSVRLIFSNSLIFVITSNMLILVVILFCYFNYCFLLLIVKYDLIRNFDTLIYDFPKECVKILFLCKKRLF